MNCVRELFQVEEMKEPSGDVVDYLREKINDESPDKDPAESFGFLIRDQAKNIIAGCNGSIIFGAIYTDQLWVHPKYRKQGLGKKLMQKVEEHGLAMGCQVATVATMHFQNALEFYERLGFEKEHVRLGVDADSSVTFFIKNL